MDELSLFTGAGGGILGTKLLGFRHIGYVENNLYCQKILKARIADGILDEAPIFGDINKFIGNGFAATFNGLVDIITGGFPCQPFSVAGKGLAEADPRNMWPQTIETIRTIKPRFVLLENVPGLLQKPYFRTILRQIAESGYDCRWAVLGASDIGANHRRKRLWILAHTNESSGSTEYGEQQEIWAEVVAGCGKAGATIISNSNEPRFKRTRWPWTNGISESARIHSSQKHLEDSRCKHIERNAEINGAKASPKTSNEPKLSIKNYGHHWAIEPALGRVAHGVANRVDRLKAIGNGQVPGVVKEIWRLMNAKS